MTYPIFYLTKMPIINIMLSKIILYFNFSLVLKEQVTLQSSFESLL